MKNIVVVLATLLSLALLDCGSATQTAFAAALRPNCGGSCIPTHPSAPHALRPNCAGCQIHPTAPHALRPNCPHCVDPSVTLALRPITWPGHVITHPNTSLALRPNCPSCVHPTVTLALRPITWPGMTHPKRA